MVNDQEFHDLLAALESLAIQHLLDAAVQAEMAQSQNEEAKYNQYLSIHHRWQAIYSQIGCIMALTRMD